MDYQQITEIIVEALGERVQNEIVRDDYQGWIERHLQDTLIKVITGFRRTGKSYLLKQLYRELIEREKAPRENIFFINFEHPLLIGINTGEKLRDLFDTFLMHAFPDMQIYLFLDEVQNVSGWEKFVRTLYDKAKDRFNIFITGSNSTLLSSELSSALGGRVVELTVYPFSFKEVLKFKGIEANDPWGYAENKQKIKLHLDRYIKYGGLPESLDLNPESIRDYTEAIFRKVLLDDIVRRFKPERPELMEDLFYFLITNSGSITSLRSLFKAMRASGKSLSLPTLTQYISYFESAFAFSKIGKFSWKRRSVFNKLYKYYPVVSAFISFYSINRRQFQSRLLEATVYNHLTRFYKKIYYGRDTNADREIDFIVDLQNGEYLKVQATFE
ncbi:MAG: ATP-binding protein, partial [Candidatus Dadabacteria bacterium]